VEKREEGSRKGWHNGVATHGRQAVRQAGGQALPLPLIYIDIMHSDPMCVNPAMRT